MKSVKTRKVMNVETGLANYSLIRKSENENTLIVKWKDKLSEVKKECRAYGKRGSSAEPKITVL